jgi:membrane dipeptidase
MTDPCSPRGPKHLYNTHFIIDTHADTPQRLLEDESPQPWDFTTSPLGHGHLNLAAARASNLAAEFFAIWVDPAQYSPFQYVSRSLALIDTVLEQVLRHPAELALCLTPADIVAAHTAGKFAILLGLEGGHSLVNSLAQLRTYHALGVRYMTLTWANSNDWAESSTDLRNPAQNPTQPPPGLTPFGREVIAEMNRLGMMIDVSHVSPHTLADVLAVTRAPVLASHSCARALCDSPRNLTDDQLRDLAANGGAVMVNFYSAFIDENYRQALIALKPERAAAHDALAARYAALHKPIPFHTSNQIDRDFAARIPRPPLSSLIAHFDHIIQIAGIDHVGIGTDFDGISALPEGIDSAADLPKITAALAARGHSTADLQKILSANLLRVFSTTQSLAE